MKIKKILRGVYRISPRKIQILLSYFYHLIFISPKCLFKPFGFFLKIKLDFYKLLNLQYKTGIKVGKFIFLPFGYNLIAESFNQELYLPLLSCKNILGLGGFVGDADIYLSQKCNKIYSFEPEKYKFRIMKKNIEINHLEEKIFPYNFAVVNSQDKKIVIKKESEMDVSASVTNYNDYNTKIREDVLCIYIKDALKLDNFDGLKCDIEGAEWGLIEYFLKNKKWIFNRAVFELHFSKKEMKKEMILLKKFLSFLKNKEYNFYFYYNLKDLKKKKSLKDFDLRITDSKKPWKTIMMFVGKE